MPKVSRTVPELTNTEIRDILFHHYRIVYRIQPDAIQILTAFEGHRLLNEESMPIEE